MPDESGPKLSDEELDRRARELFAEVRQEHPEERAGRALKSAGEAAGEAGSDLLGRIFGAASDDEAGGDEGGD